MADQVTPDTPADEQEKDQEKDKQPADSNLRGELERRKEAQKRAEKELADLREKILEFEDRDKTELQRAQERATRAETQLGELSSRITAMEKGAWVRSAAAEFNFHDPEDAVVNLSGMLGEFEDQREARRAVEKLAKTKSHLIREDKPADKPRIGQVLNNGQPQTNPQQVAQMNPAQAAYQQAAQREIEFATGLAEALGEFRNGWRNFGGS